MMQPSDLDRKILPLSPNTKKQNRASDPTVKNHLSAVPKSTNCPEQTQDVCENVQTNTSSSPKTEVSPESETGSNGNRRSLSVATASETESAQLDESGVNGDTESENGGEQGFLPVLRNPNFLALWGCQVFCQMADKVYLVLMTFWAMIWM